MISAVPLPLVLSGACCHRLFKLAYCIRCRHYSYVLGLALATSRSSACVIGPFIKHSSLWPLLLHFIFFSFSGIYHHRLGVYSTPRRVYCVVYEHTYIDLAFAILAVCRFVFTFMCPSSVLSNALHNLVVITFVDVIILTHLSS